MHNFYHNIHGFVDNDMGHDYNCFHRIGIYFEERNRNYYSYCLFLSNDLIPDFCLDQNEYIYIYIYIHIYIYIYIATSKL